jgi:hypothetical protein
LVNVTLDTFGLDDSLITWSGVELSQSEKRSGRTNEKMIIAKILPLADYDQHIDTILNISRPVSTTLPKSKITNVPLNETSTVLECHLAAHEF